MAYEPRTYRRAHDPADLVSFEVVVRETDLHISALSDLSQLAEELVLAARADLEGYIRSHPRFFESYVPLDVDRDAPAIVHAMADAARLAGVGPMAAVAGAVAEYVARGLSAESPEVIVENGGDCFLMGRIDRTLGLWTGQDGVPGVGLTVSGDLMPIGVCTSSGRFGHSTSFGSADTLTVLAADGSLADAVATALANRVHGAEDVDRVLEDSRSIPGLAGVVITAGGRIGAWGAVTLGALT